MMHLLHYTKSKLNLCVFLLWYLCISVVACGPKHHLYLYHVRVLLVAASKEWEQYAESKRDGVCVQESVSSWTAREPVSQV